MENSIMVSSLSQFVEEINKIEPKSEIRSVPQKLLFRGQSSYKYDLMPSLGRKPSEKWFDSWLREEQYLVNTAQQKFPMIFSSTDFPAILLAKLQHYGIKTRMLDLTENALVALYFACLSNPDIDGEVIVFSAVPISVYNPLVNAIADTYRLDSVDFMPFDLYFYRVTRQAYYLSALRPDELFESESKYFSNLITHPFFVEAGNICERQKNQGGNFIIFPNQICESDSKKIISNSLVKMDKNDDCIIKRLQISKECKQIILHQLQRFGITDSFLFADSVDEVCKSIVTECKKRYPEYYIQNTNVSFAFTVLLNY